MVILETKDLSYSYSKKNKILKKVNIEFEEGKIYAILGHSGCGKTTLLSLLGGLDSPTNGEILFIWISVNYYLCNKLIEIVRSFT